MYLADQTVSTFWYRRVRIKYLRHFRDRCQASYLLASHSIQGLQPIIFRQTTLLSTQSPTTTSLPWCDHGHGARQPPKLQSDCDQEEKTSLVTSPLSSMASRACAPANLNNCLKLPVSIARQPPVTADRCIHRLKMMRTYLLRHARQNLTSTENLLSLAIIIVLKCPWVLLSMR